MDIDESIEAYRVKIGDLVIPMDSEEFLFSSAFAMDSEVDPIECCWSGIPGIVTGVEDFVPPRGYMRIRVMVEGMVGWTYSDYIKTIHR